MKYPCPNPLSASLYPSYKKGSLTSPPNPLSYEERGDKSTDKLM
jgi:hypothetical protein